jgi:hypothetical protein
MKTALHSLTLVCLVSLCFFTACSKSNPANNSLANFQPEIANTTDNFQLQATNVTQTTTTIDYNWTNTGSSAAIDKSGILSAGAASLMIFDKNGTNISTSDLKVTGSGTTSTGVAGTWRIRLVLTNYDGTLNFRVQKK